MVEQTKTFKDIDGGEFFHQKPRKDGPLFLKLRHSPSNTNNTMKCDCGADMTWNAVRVEDGGLVHFCDTSFVWKEAE